MLRGRDGRGGVLVGRAPGGDYAVNPHVLERPHSGREGRRVNLVDRLTNALLRQRWLALAVAVAMCLVGWPVSRRLQFDQSIESLYAPSNPRLQAFVRSKAIFGGDEFLIFAYREARLFQADDRLTEEAQQRLERLAEQVAALPGVDPSTIQHLGTALRVPYGRSRIRQFMEGVLVGADGQTVAVAARLLAEGASATPRRETFRQARALAAAHHPPAVVVGEPIQVHDMFRYVEEDGSTLGLWSTALLMTIIFLLFRSVRWMVLPLAVVQAALIWTKALLVWSGMQLSMVSSMLDSLVTIIAIATVTHVTVRFREQSTHADRETALRETLRQLSVPVFWTVITTAAGFAALLSSRITPVASFGLMMALATLLVLVAAALMVPGMVLLGAKTLVPAVAPAEQPLTATLGRLTEWVARRPTIVAASMALFSALCSVGLFRLHVETDFSKNFRAHSPLVQALNLFETHLGGAGTWEVNFPAPHELTDDYLEQVEALTDELRKLQERTTPDRLTKVVSLTDGLSLIPKDLFFARVPLSTRLLLLDRIQPDFLRSLYNAEAGRMRIVLRAAERQPADTKLKLIEDVERLARARFPGAEATGLFVLLAYLIESLMADQLTSSLIAATAIVLFMTIAQRSVWLGLALILPNLFPIVLVVGSMGLVGMKINIATAMIASVSMGLTIDSSIHYLAGYRAARRAGKSFPEAIKRTHQGVGLALVFANVALVVGFTVLTLSHFVPLIYFGVLVSVAMLGGLIGNLVLLPLILRWLDRGPPEHADLEPVRAQPAAATDTKDEGRSR